MRFLSLFSGIEAASQAWHPLGWECVAVAEIEPFPCAVLAHHYPDVPNLGSVTDITDAKIAALGPIDLVVGGSPCQDLSVAGKRAGLAGKRSGLFSEQMRIFHAARRFCGARFCLWENVPGAFSSNKGRDFAVVVGDMAGARLCVPRNGWQTTGAALGKNGLCEWAVLDAQWFGVAQRRRRVFALLDTGDWAGRPPILLERESLSGNLAPSREAREGPASFTPSSIGGYRDGCGTLRANGGDIGPGSETLITHTLSGRGFDASEDGRGRGTPLVPWPAQLAPTLNAAFWDKQGLEDQHALNGAGLFVPADRPLTAGMSNGPREDIAKCLTTRTGSAFDPETETLPVAFPSNANTDAIFAAGRNVSPTMQAGGHAIAVAYGMAVRGREGGAQAELTPELANCLRTNTGGGSMGMVASPMAVRRLTPVECERLQGFPDDFTRIPYRNKNADQCPDGPRYKALGNSMAVPCMFWIGRRIQEVDSL